MLESNSRVGIAPVHQEEGARRPKVAIVFPDLRSGKGVEAYTLDLVRRLAKYFEVHVFASVWESLPETVHVHKVRALQSPYFLRLLSFALMVTHVLRRYRFDLVNVQSCSALAADVVTAHSCHKAYVQFSRSLSGSERVRKALNPFHYVALFICTQLFSANRLRLVIALSEGVKKEISLLYGIPADRILTIPAGVDLEKFQPTNRAAFRISTRESFGLGDEDFVILFVGNEFHRKGLHFLFDALTVLSNPKIKLLVVGHPSKIAQVEYAVLARRKGITSRVTLAGHQPSMERIYAAGDIFVLPSLYEAFPSVALEAASSGLPVLATKVNGVEEFLVDGYNGWFISPDGADIAEKIAVLVADRNLCQTLGQNARKSVQRYDWNSVRGQLIAAYELAAKMPTAQNTD